MGRNFNWAPGLFLLTFQPLVVAILPIYLYFYTPSWALILISIALLYATGLSITAGYHRYFAHRSYKTHPWIESILIFLGSMAVQGSVLRWACDHRLHHAHVDTDQDPYSIKKGFWYAHFLWILEKPAPINPKIVSDLMANPRVMFQEKYSISLMIASNFIVWLLVGFLLNDFVGALMIATALRIFVLHHFTWFINSLAHTWGDRPFCQEQSAVNNYVISLLTFGEGYHNYHHTYANDYRNGVRWYHFDPTKWLIWSLNKLGLAHGLKKMDWETINKRLVIERKNMLMREMKEHSASQTLRWQEKLESYSENLIKQISKLGSLKAEYKELKKSYAMPDLVESLHSEIKKIRKCLRQDIKGWKQLLRDIQSDMQMKVA